VTRKGFNVEVVPRAVALMVALVLCGGCGGPQAPERSAGSALWVSSDSRAIARAELGRLEGFGVGELFVETASLRWEPAGVELGNTEWYTPPRRVRATLVVTGEWPPEGPGGAAAARRLAPALESLAAEADRRGLVPVGIHFDLEGSSQADALESYGRFLAAARRLLAPDLAVSATLGADWLDEPQVRRVAAGADFLVPFLYGQRRWDRDEVQVWDLLRIGQALRSVDALGRPFLVGVGITGSGAAYGPGGELVGATSGIGLHHLAWSQSLEPELGSALQALDRRAYTFAARGAVRLGDLSLPRGGRVRLVGTSTAHLARLLDEVQGLRLENHLGQVFHRLPAPGDQLSLDLPHVVSALTGGPTSPAPQVELQVISTAPRRWLLSLTLENLNAEPSTLAWLENNYVEVEVSGGVFGAVEAGDFYRWDLLAPGEGGRPVRVYRGATVLRFYAPVLAAGARLGSGPFEVRLAGPSPPRITLSARFLAPYGQEISFGPESWEREGSASQ
jgi:hypothetical protein